MATESGARQIDLQNVCVTDVKERKKFWKNFRTAPYLIMHVHLTGDTLNNKAPYMDV